MGKQWKQCQTLFLRAPKSLQMVIAAMKLKDTYSLEESYDQPRQHIKKQRHYFINKGPSSQSYGFSSSHVWLWELDYKESWTLKNWCFSSVLLEKTLESPLDCKDIQPVHLKEISPGISLEGMMLKLKLQYFGHLMWRTDSLEKILMLGVWASSGSWWWTGKSGVLQSMGSQRVGHDWVSELNWILHISLISRVTI